MTTTKISTEKVDVFYEELEHKAVRLKVLQWIVNKLLKNKVRWKTIAMKIWKWKDIITRIKKWKIQKLSTIEEIISLIEKVNEQ